jgi:hypothetical protein
LLIEQKIHYVAAIKSERQWNKAKAMQLLAMK